MDDVRFDLGAVLLMALLVAGGVTVFAAIRRDSSLVSSFAADPGPALRC